MFNVILPGMPAGFTYLSSRADGYVDMWAKDDGSGRQKWKLIERKVEEKEDEPKKAPKKKEKKAKK